MLYYSLDLLVGFGCPFVIYALYRAGKLEKLIWSLFWAGAAIGLIWEIPIFVLSAETSEWATIHWVRPLPLHYSIFLVSHTLWDGALFLVGVWLAQRFCDESWWTRFSGRALIIMLVWGQLSELLVEISSTSNDGWAFVRDHAWNPTLFECNHQPITLFPQLVWLAAPVLYYGVLRALARRRG
ncbi:MAG: hypothetical protein GXP55_02975 [Deltaproteobacteria bacterium]|nr:hypothetical protein [Deltaproteobacteria bacterium]